MEGVSPILTTSYGSSCFLQVIPSFLSSPLLSFSLSLSLSPSSLHPLSFLLSPLSPLLHHINISENKIRQKFCGRELCPPLSRVTSSLFSLFFSLFSPLPSCITPQHFLHFPYYIGYFIARHGHTANPSHLMFFSIGTSTPYTLQCVCAISPLMSPPL